jgi:hypothetical protein
LALAAAFFSRSAWTSCDVRRMVPCWIMPGWASALEAQVTRCMRGTFRNLKK